MKADCVKFEGCNAPLCPLDEDVADYVWYPDEYICNCQQHNQIDWVRRQRKIAKKVELGYFTLEMLNRNCVIGANMRGLDPDEPEASQLKNWLSKHKEKKPISEEKRKTLKQSMGNIRDAICPEDLEKKHDLSTIDWG